MDYVIGIDPGGNGGMALIPKSKSTIESICFDKFTERELAQKFLEWSLLDVHAFMEKVASMPRQGVKSMFTFGKNYGLLRGFLYAYKIPFDEVLPQTWMKGTGVIGKFESKTERKQALKGIAQRLFPYHHIVNDTADAILIAEYGYRTMFRGIL